MRCVDRRSSLLVLLLAVLGAACQGSAQSASEKLRDAVVFYNDALRFGRTDLALERVAQSARSDFVGGHYRWGRGIDIADYEIVNVEAAGEELEHAVSFVTVRWVAQGTMLLRETLLRQEWAKRGRDYELVQERAVDGDTSLLAIPEGFRPESSAFTRPTDADGQEGADGADGERPETPGEGTAPPDAGAPVAP